MHKVSLEEVTRLAQASRIFIADHEREQIAQSIGEVLNYVDLLNDIVAKSNVTTRDKSIPNTVRKDSPITFLPEELLAQAPEAIDQLFVVPTILKHENKI